MRHGMTITNHPTGGFLKDFKGTPGITPSYGSQNRFKVTLREGDNSGPSGLPRLSVIENGSAKLVEFANLP